MAISLPAEEFKTLARAFSGLGVDEPAMISLLTKWHPDQRKSFRKSCPSFFADDERFFERWERHHIEQLEVEFARFKKAVMLWTMHPWQRDADFAYLIIHRGYPLSILIEIACTRSSEELLGARKAYHSLFHHSIEDVAYHVKDDARNLMVALVSSYRYEGPTVNIEIAKSEAKILAKAIKENDSKKILANEDVIRILSTRSRLQLRLTFDHYKEIHGKSIDEHLEEHSILKATVQCLYHPPTYFSKVLDHALHAGADELTKEALTRVIITRADVDMKEIKETYHKIHGVHLEHKIKVTTCGNFKDFMLSLVARGGH